MPFVRRGKQTNVAGLFFWLAFGLSVAFGPIGCLGEIGDSGVDVVWVDGGLWTGQGPPPVRRPPATPDQSQPTDDPATATPDVPGTPPTGDQEPTTPVFYNDVFNGLLREFCTPCHNDKSARSRIDYYSHVTHELIAKEKTPVAYWTRAWGLLKSGTMPLIKPDAEDEKERLAEGVALFERWAKAGFPPGNAAKAPPNEGKEDPSIVFPVGASCRGNKPLRSRIWRLTALQIRNSIHDLLGSDITIPDFRLSRKRAGGLSNSANESGLDNVDVTTLVKTFEAVSADVLSKNARWKACLGQQDNTCVKQLIADDGKRLWRRAVTQAEIDKLVKGFESLAPDSRQIALGYVLERMLLSSHFLFRAEIGKPVAGQAGTNRLTPHEVASFLSFNLWQSIPDTALLDAAEKSQLNDTTQVSTQIQRMLQDPRAKRGLTVFFADWLHIFDLRDQEKDTSTFKQLTPQLRQEVIQAATLYLDHVLWQQKGNIQDVFTSKLAFLNEAVSKLYSGLNVTGSDFQQVNTDPAKRAGILTTPAFLMAQAGKDTTGFVHRGVFFLEELLCRPVGDPPMGAVAAGQARVAKVDTSKMTQREIMETIHSADASCNSCHKKIDPIGAAFESFDALGQFRLTEKGKTIDPSGKIEGYGDLKPDFKNSIELIKNLATSKHFQQCLTMKLYTHLWGRPPEGERNCALASLYEGLQSKGFQLLQAHQALLGDKQFFLRSVPED